MDNDYKRGQNCIYAQWENAGPSVYDDSSYVFGSNPPKNNAINHSGLDVSPAVNDYIGLYADNNIVSWKFVYSDQVSDGPWKKIITTS